MLTHPRTWSKFYCQPGFHCVLTRAWDHFVFGVHPFLLFFIGGYLSSGGAPLHKSLIPFVNELLLFFLPFIFQLRLFLRPDLEPVPVAARHLLARKTANTIILKSAHHIRLRLHPLDLAGLRVGYTLSFQLGYPVCGIAALPAST